MKGKALALLLLLGVALLVAPSRAETVEDDDDDEYGDLDAAAHLLIRRKLSEEKTQLGKVVTVLVEIFNAGTGDAKSVSVKEDAFRPEEFHIEGQLDAEYDAIPVGSSRAFSYSITPKESGKFSGTPTFVTYIAEDAGKPVTTRAPQLLVQVFTSTELLKDQVLGYGSTATLGMLSTESDWIRFAAVVAGGSVLYTLFGAYNALVKSRANAKRRRALRDLGMTDDLKTK